MSSATTLPEAPVEGTLPLPRKRGAILKNLADFQTELGRVAAGFVPSMRDWANRKEMPRQVFIDFRLVQDLSVRHKELGIAIPAVHLSRAVPARPLIELLCAAPSSADALAAIYGRTKARLAHWIKETLQNDLGIYDIPSTPLLEANLAQLERQIAWAEAARAAEGPVDEAYQRQVEAALAGLPEALLNPERRSAEPCREGRRIGRLPLLNSAVPSGFATRATVPPRDEKDDSYAAAERFYAANFLQEVQAADSCASLLFDAPDLPPEFYFDCARHMWDEARHSIFGEKKLAALGIPLRDVPLSSTAYQMRQTLAPHDRYAALTTQEADAFPGKHKGLKAALENNDALGAMTWSYDIADETQHVRYGQKWLPALIEAVGDPRSLAQVKSDAENWRATVLAAAYHPDRPQLYRAAKA
jgi:hypothetical protein